MSSVQPGLLGLPEGRPEPVEQPLLRKPVPIGLFLGTSSWSFPGWQGLLWRDQHEAKELSRSGLRAYAESGWLRSVSLDRTYYAAIAPREFAELGAQVPKGFRFVVKAPRQFTEPRVDGRRNLDFLRPELVQRRILDPAIEGLGERCGQILLQFAPGASRLFVAHRSLFDERLSALLRSVDRGPARLCVEVRDGRLFDDRFLDLLASYEALPCLTVHPAMPPLAAQWQRLRHRGPGELTIRWNLAPGRRYDEAKRDFAPFDRLVAEDSMTRGVVADAARTVLGDGGQVTVIANNKAEGSAPLTLARVAEAI